MFRSSRLFRLIAPIALILAVAAVAAPAGAAKGTSKQYTVDFVLVPGDDDEVEITVTISNLPTSSAVLGSANVTPTGFTGISDLSVEASNDKPWTASLSGSVIRLRTTDGGKLSPGEFVSVSFTATPPASTGSYSIVTAAKTSRDFSGSGNFTLVGSNPAIVVCPDTDDCTASVGDVDNPAPNQQAGEVTVTDCEGCILAIWRTLGDFCSEPPTPGTANCATASVPAFTITGFIGTLTFIVACDESDCPDLGEDEFYNIFINHNDGPTTTSDEITELGEDDLCGEYGSPPCIEDQFRLESNNDLQTHLQLEFDEESVDPKISHILFGGGS